MSTVPSSPQYWRDRRQWSSWIGKKGTVLGCTLIQVAPPEFAYLVPYPYVLVDFGSEKKLCIGTGHSSFPVGEIVECVWRRMGEPESTSIIPYGIKVQPYVLSGKDTPEDFAQKQQYESEETESENESNRRSTR